MALIEFTCPWPRVADPRRSLFRLSCRGAHELDKHARYSLRRKETKIEYIEAPFLIRSDISAIPHASLSLHLDPSVWDYA